jgi:hypothetical protein
MRIATGACLLSIALLSASVAKAQNVSDATGPEISNITFATTSVNTTAGSQNVGVSVSATDDLSGVNYLYVYLRTASNSQPYNNTTSINCYVGTLQSGTRTNGVFTGTCTFPQYSQAGPWFVYQAYAYDNVGNYRSYYNNSAQLPIAPQTISVTSPTAALPSVPTLVSYSASPGSVDTSASSQTVTLRAHITSTGNFYYAFVALCDPAFQRCNYVYFWDSTRVSGDISDGIYETTMSLPRYSRSGNWAWYYSYLYNTSNNYAYYANATNGAFTYTYNSASGTSTNLGASGPTLTPNNLVVTSNPSDTVGPTLSFFDVSPSSIDVAAQGTYVTVAITATDQLSGFNYGCAYFRSPNGQQQRGACPSNGSPSSIYFPQYSEAGTWTLSNLYLYDVLGNVTSLTSQYLFDHGFPNTIQISSGLAVASASGTIGGSVTLSAVLTNLGVPVAGKTITFTLQGNPVGSAITDAAGKATLPSVSLGSLTAGTYVNAIVAAFAGDGTLAASSGQATLTVTNKLSQTIAFSTIADHYLSDSPIAVSATASSGLPVSFDAVGNCTVSGSTVTLTAVGSCQIVASQAGNASYNPAPSVSRTFNITRINQTITFGALANKTYGDATFGLTATASSGLTVTFATGSGSVGCSVSGTTVTITAATAAGQSCIIVASQNGDGTYNPAPNVTRSFTIAKAPQTITFGALPNKTYGDLPFAVSATGTSGLAVTFALGAGSVGCSVSGSTVTVTAATAAGLSCILVASQSGNTNYNAATSVTQSFTIAKASQTITFGSLPNKTYGDGPFGVAASAPGGTVGFALGAGSAGCSLSGSTVTITGATGPGETCAIVASQTGNGNYNPAPNVTQTFAIAKGSQTILFGALPNKTYGDGAFGITATAPAGTVGFALGSGSVGCSVSGNMVTITGATGPGESCTITASQAGDANYNAAADVSRSFTIAKGSQTITFGALANRTFGDPSFAVSATAPGGTVGFALGAASVGCSLSGDMVTITGATGVGQSCIIEASQGGDSNYDAAASVSQGFAIAKAAQTIAFGALSNKTYGDAAFTVSATAPGGSVGVALGAGSVGCSVAGNTVSITGATGAGEACIIVASQDGSANYSAAADVSQSFTIAKAAQTISFGALSNKTYGDAAFTVSATAPAGSVGFALGAGSVGCSLAGNTVSITGATGAGESCILVASQSGDSNYNAAENVSQGFAIAKAAQTIAFGALSNRTYGEAPFGITATAPGGAVSFTLGAGSVGCSVAGNTVSITGATGAGEACIIVASQDGSANYNAAANATRSFTIAKASQTIVFGSLPDKTYGAAPFTVSATATSNLAVAFTASGACSVSGATVTITTGGICTVTAAQAGNGNYDAAPIVVRQFDVAYTWSNVLQPINIDGTSIFKLGSTIPVKFQLTGPSAAITNLAARIYVAPVSNSIVGSEVEAVSTSASDAGNTFRYDASAGQYVFNLGTKTLTQGSWQIRIDLQDAASAPHTVVISLKK